MQTGSNVRYGFVLAAIGLFGTLFVWANYLFLVEIGPRNFLGGVIELSPLLCLGPLTLMSVVFLGERERRGWRAFPLLVGIITIVIGSGLAWYKRQDPFFGFNRRLADYEAVVASIESGNLQPAGDGYVPLTGSQRDLSIVHAVLVADEMGGATYYFIIGSDEFDPSTYGYLYRPTGLEPSEQGLCQHWDRVSQELPGWYVCDDGPYDGAKLREEQGVR